MAEQILPPDMPDSSNGENKPQSKSLLVLSNAKEVVQKGVAKVTQV